MFKMFALAAVILISLASSADAGILGALIRAQMGGNRSVSVNVGRANGSGYSFSNFSGGGCGSRQLSGFGPNNFSPRGPFSQANFVPVLIPFPSGLHHDHDDEDDDTDEEAAEALAIAQSNREFLNSLIEARLAEADDDDDRAEEQTAALLREIVREISELKAAQNNP